MIEGTFNRAAKTLTWNGVTYKIKGMIDVQGKTLDVINSQCTQIYNELGRPALIYTNKGLWDGLVDKSGIKDNISAKTYLFLAWFGTVQPEYGKNNTVLPSGWTQEWMAMWNDKDGHYKLLKDGGEALRTLLEFCEVATDDSASQDEDPEETNDGDGSSGGTTSGSTIIHMVCPKCGAQIF